VATALAGQHIKLASLAEIRRGRHHRAEPDRPNHGVADPRLSGHDDTLLHARSDDVMGDWGNPPLESDVARVLTLRKQGKSLQEIADILEMQPA
jgi:hypothetical protein